MKAPPGSIPLGDAGVFGQRACIVRRVRMGLAALVVVAAVLGLVSVLRPTTVAASLLPSSSTGIIVLDVSASISSDTYARIGTTLDRLIRSNRSYGLVLFSDTAYQALPPNTPARELRPVRRFFDVSTRQDTGVLSAAPRNPWTESFGAGTRISTGLSLALDIIRADRIPHPAVLLVSDLDNDTGDLERVSRIAAAYRRAGIPLKVVGLNADPEDAAFIRRLVPGNGKVTEATLPTDRSGPVSSGMNRLLMGAALLVAVGLSAFLLLAAPLRWRSI
ncbi:MAG: vWA domain-containing protein [Thermoleophilia bacterium]